MDDNEDPSLLIANAAKRDRPSSYDDEFSTLERLKITQDQAKLDIKVRQQELDQENDNHDLRKNYANKIFWLISTWLFCVISVLIASGLEIYTQFHLPNYVLIAFVITTTINVLGLFAIVAKWMFQPQGKK